MISTESVWAAQHAEPQPCPRAVEHAWKLRNLVVTQNLGLAREVAHRWSGQCSEPYEDLYQIAVIGLIKAVERFDRNKGAAFSSLAVPYIEGEIKHFLRDHDWDGVGVSRRRIETASKVRRIRRRWVDRGRLDIDEGKVARSLGYSADQWREIEEETARKTVLSLEDAEWVTAEQPSDEDALRQELGEALQRLPNPFRVCLAEWGLANLSEEAIARAHGVSAEQVHAWIEEGLQRVRIQLNRRLG